MTKKAFLRGWSMPPPDGTITLKSEGKREGVRMAKRLDFVGPKEIAFIEVEERRLAADEVRLTALYSGISAGTQLTAYRGVNPFVHKQFNGELRIFEPRAEPASSLY